MCPEMSPEDVAQRTFRVTFRGYDADEVSGYLRQTSEALGEIANQRDRLAARLADLGARDLKGEFAAVSTEVGAVLEAARVAAEAMRERAASDAAQWRSEAQAAAQSERDDAAADAEKLRSDAWVTAEQLLTQVGTEGEQLRRTAERDSLTIRGEAERSAHRMTSAARREADELLRTVRMEGERVSLDAGVRRDEIVEAARRQAETSQERTRALEQRRHELLEEIESVRGVLGKMEEDLSTRKESFARPPEPAPVDDDIKSIKLVPGRSDDDWDPSETIRIIRPPAAEPPEPTAQEMADEVRRMRDDTTAIEESESAATVEQAEAAQSEPSQPAETQQKLEHDDWRPEELSVLPPAAGGIDDLFRRLRGPAAETAVSEPVASPPQTPVAEEAPRVETETPVETAPEDAIGSMPVETKPGPRATSQGDPFGLKERLLLPISNRALRSLKRQLTEEQNEVLEHLRLEEAWLPTPKTVAERIRADLVLLAAESFAAGHSAAEELAGRQLSRPPTPKRDDAVSFSEALLGDLDEQASLRHHGRQLVNEVSRVFRTWRTDEAERRVADLAGDSYHRGLATSLDGGVRVTLAGRGCATCRAAAESSEPTAAAGNGAATESTPPLHPGCTCTLVPV